MSMRKLLGTITLVVIIIAIVGSKRDWFKLDRTTHGTNTEVHLRIDRDKIRQDRSNARDMARELRENLEHKLERKSGQ
jgi:hypothetical protein